MVDVSLLLKIIAEYGYAGLFLVSFLGSTIFIPLTTEVLLGMLIGAGLNAYYVVIIASIGSTLGSTVNYFLGKLGIKYYTEKVRKTKNKDKWREIANRYGILGLFVVLALPIPLPVDILTVAAGISKMDLKYFLIAVFFAKLLRYAFYAGLVKVIV